jgi:hypothetical protein
MVVWNSYSQKISEKTEYNNMLMKSFQVSDILVKSAGYPLDWNSGNVKVIGLASGDRNLSMNKTNMFINLSINKTKSIFQTERYNFYFSLKRINGTNITSYGNYPSGKKIVNIRRYVLYNNESAVFDFSIWK